jgi:uncharacterized protein (TIGR00251 family)
MSIPQAVRISVRVHPGGRRSEVLRFQEGIWHIRVTAPPVEGKANAGLVRYLAGLLGIPESSVAIEHGQTSRNKLLRISGLTARQVESQLNQSLSKRS